MIIGAPVIILGENWIIGENSGKLGTWFIIGEDMLDVGSSPEFSWKWLEMGDLVLKD